MHDGFYRPKYRDKKTGKQRTAKVYWSRDPVSGRRVSTGCRSIEGARAWQAERERRANDPRYAASHEASVGGWVKKVLAIKEKTKAEGTANMYRTKFGHIVRIFGEASPVATITPDAVDRYVEQRQEEGAGNNTIGKELTAIVQLCKHAKRARQYADDISALRPVGFSIDYVPRTGHLERADIKALRGELEAHQMAAVKLIVATSCRVSEYMRLQREHVDTKRWIVSVPGTKTKKARRFVPIPQMFRALLKDALPYVGEKWISISKQLPEACVRAGVQRLTPNDLRRTHSTWLIEAGVSKALVADSLGHVGTRMVDLVYDASEAEAALALMEAQIAAAKKPSKSRRRKTQKRSAA